MFFKKLFRKFLKKRRKKLNKVIQGATDRISVDILDLTEEKEDTLSLFRATANKLGKINEELTEKSEDLKALSVFIKEQDAATQLMISDNEAVRSKILEIIGK